MRLYVTIFILAIVVPSISGCYDFFYSLHPGYTKDTLVYDEKLLGEWGEEKKDQSIEPFMEFREGGGNKYLLELSDDSGEFNTDIIMEACVFKVEENHFLDIYISEKHTDSNSYNPFCTYTCTYDYED